MEQQSSFAQSEYARKKRTTRREKFLAQMEAVVPWARLVALIEPHYPAGKRGRPPVGVERMLRLHFLAQCYALADEAIEDALYDSQAHALLHGVEKRAVADAGLQGGRCRPCGVEKRPEIVALGGDLEWRIAARRSTHRAQPEGWAKALSGAWEKLKARVRAIVEHPVASALRRCPSGKGSALWLSRSARLTS